MKPSTVIISIIATVAIMAFGLIALAAMQAGGWTFIALIVGVAALSGIAAGLIAFGLRSYERWIKTRVEAKRAADDHEYRMAREGLILKSGLFIPRHYAALPEPVQPQQTPADPRHELLVKLCIATIRSTKYGPESAKLMSASDAQEVKAFADRERWVDASKYGQELGYLAVRNGGNRAEQGLIIKESDDLQEPNAVSLIEALNRHNLRLDGAVATLPTVAR